MTVTGLLLFSLLSLAAPDGSASATEVAPPRLMDALTSVPANIARATPALRILNLRQACSGFFISNDGYFLTAAHCVKHILPRIALHLQDGRDELSGTMAFSFFSRTPDLVLDPGDQGFLAQDIAPQKPQLVFAGEGFLVTYPSRDSLRRLPPDSAAWQWLRRWNDDFVILKFSGQDFSCIPFNPPAAKPTATVTLLGYSLLQPNRLGNHFYPRLYLSQAPSAPRQEEARRAMIGVYDRVFSDDSVDFVGASILAGMSGGPVLNEHGLLLGVTTLGFAVDPTQASDRAGYVRVEKIRELLKERFGEKDAGRFFSCHETYP
ncbi:MAG: trypsin-like peptidase domain-containing protein [Bdellovibrionaceae bacterium]|nr:trypsin-like peptidase domain-containing protein [Pseudobdellovibrionaceae bacterium]MBX3032356.1 trypsin-like peptidase domain-containing protein [Pseudobdellovibrionaceae bacterium]